MPPLTITRELGLKAADIFLDVAKKAESSMTRSQEPKTRLVQPCGKVKKINNRSEWSAPTLRQGGAGKPAQVLRSPVGGKHSEVGRDAHRKGESARRQGCNVCAPPWVAHDEPRQGVSCNHVAHPCMGRLPKRCRLLQKGRKPPQLPQATRVFFSSPSPPSRMF